MSNNSKVFKGLFFVIASIFCILYYDLLLGKEIFTYDSILWYESFRYKAKSVNIGLLL